MNSSEKMVSYPLIPGHLRYVPVLVLLEDEEAYCEALYGTDGCFRFGYDEPVIENVEHWMDLPKRAQPAEQCQAAPVTLPARMAEDDPKWWYGACPNHDYDEVRGQAEGWNACLDEIAKLGPLYLRPAQGAPVAWLREDGSDAWTAEKKNDAIAHNGKPGAAIAAEYPLPLYAHADPAEGKKWRLRAIASAQAVNAQLDETNDLRAQLAEAHALLRWASDVLEVLGKGEIVRKRIADALSASAEPGTKQEFREHLDKCAAEVATWPDWKREALGPAIGTFEGCSSAGSDVPGLAIEGAPAEIDERGAFEDYECNAPDGPQVDPIWMTRCTLDPEKYGINSVQADWDAWRSRAALERKP